MLNALAAPDPRDPTTMGQAARGFHPRGQGRLDRGHADCGARFQPAAGLHGSRRGARLAGGRPHFREPRRQRRGGALADWSSTWHRRPASSRRRDVLAASRVDRRREQGDRPRVRGRALQGKHFVTGAYAEELASWASAARSSMTGFNPTTRSWPRPSRCGHPAGSEVEETSPIPGYLTRPGNYLASARSPCHRLRQRPAARCADHRQAFPRARRAQARQGVPGRERLPSPRARSVELGSLRTLRHALGHDGGDDRGIERFVLVIADGLVELGAGLHFADHVVCATVSA